MKINRPTPSPRRQSGFTLLEIVIVLGIIAMLMGSAIFAMKNIGDGAKLKRADADFINFDSALSMYKMNAGSYPTSSQGLAALKDKPTTTPTPRRWAQYLSRIPKDPWGSDYIYRFPSKKKANEVELISKGPDAQENTDDDLSSQDE